jgi:hypothetical protein
MQYMSRSYDNWHGQKVPQKYWRHATKKKRDRKQFVYRGDGWATKARGGPGNKAAYGRYSGHGYVAYPKHLFEAKRKGYESSEKDDRAEIREVLLHAGSEL